MTFLTKELMMRSSKIEQGPLTLAIPCGTHTVELLNSVVHPKSSREFIDWLTSDEVGKKIAETEVDFDLVQKRITPKRENGQKAPKISQEKKIENAVTQAQLIFEQQVLAQIKGLVEEALTHGKIRISSISAFRDVLVEQLRECAANGKTPLAFAKKKNDAKKLNRQVMRDAERQLSELDEYVVQFSSIIDELSAHVQNAQDYLAEQKRNGNHVDRKGPRGADRGSERTNVVIGEFGRTASDGYRSKRLAPLSREIPDGFGRGSGGPQNPA